MRKIKRMDQIKSILKELRRTGVTHHLLWQEYRREYPDGYGYGQFCERLKTEKVGVISQHI